MMRSFTAISVLALLAACGDGQPFYDIVDDDDAPDVEIELDGTENPNVDRSIVRIEPGQENENGALIANETGGGLVREVFYNEEDDTYTIDNLAFDGANVYNPDAVFPTLNGYPIYQADITTPDVLTGAPVNQIRPYRAITGRSDVQVPVGDEEEGLTAPRTTFAIVRTGGYDNYGFGGFVYARNGGVTLPSSGQAQWEGQYAGARVFRPIAKWEFTTGDVEIAIDFEDFDLNDGVKGFVFNRVAFEPDGTPVPLNAPDGELLLPDISFEIVQGIDTLLETGEFAGRLSNTRINSSGRLEIYEEGDYYGIVAGDTTLEGDGGEIVGVFVVESEDPRQQDRFVQETGGFILQRSE